MKYLLSTVVLMAILLVGIASIHGITQAQTGCDSSFYSIASPAGYTFSKDCMTIGKQMYNNDNRFSFFLTPGISANLSYVKTGNTTEKDNVDLQWSINVIRQSQVYIFYRKIPGQTVPAWISQNYTKLTSDDFGNINQFLLRKSDQGLIGVYDIYQRNGLANGVVTFGPASDASISAFSMYLVGIASQSTATPSPNVGGSVVFAGAGNISNCSNSGSNDGASAKTAQLIQTLGPDAKVFAGGDNAHVYDGYYGAGKCYDRSWGQFKERTYPVIGNHEYADGIQDYFTYFGPRVNGPDALGYYSYEVGAWHAVALNSEIAAKGWHPDSAGFAKEIAWLRQDLASHTNKCKIAIMHRTPYTAGPHGDWSDVKPLWTELYNGGVSVVIAGAVQAYERTNPLDGNGSVVGSNGMMQIATGTGGDPGTSWAISSSPITAVIHGKGSGVFSGITKLTLRSTNYDFQFIPTPGTTTFTDSGTGACR